MLLMVFKRHGLAADIAVDGADAIERVASTQYAVVLVDLMMPRVDGAAFVKALRKREESSSRRLVVLMMTATPAREPVMHLGDSVQALISKPFDVLEIAEVVKGCVEGLRQYGGGPDRHSATLGAA